MNDSAVMWLWLKALLSLGLILPLIYGIVYLLKRYTAPNKDATSGIHLVKQLVLGNKERIVVVEVEKVKLVIGISQHTFNTLHVINNEK